MTTDPATELYECLEATAELPVDRTASRLLGEAQAVAADVRDVDDAAVATERAGVVADLLAEVDGTGHPAADEHVARARELAARLSEP
ncbi:hypothetical protein [Halobellus clavatus]|jgi:hypothetical protein|uniref:DUF8152 domain-containing protein n=1 Tax=Halobellus clavatus TaxID=660517 RepID=A0A1H3GJM3_9EURY|nr:hypothetical protein [Halobellus clavatus]SDY03506.1 hypothetical protein SAMN04487946_105210 [Halobellus clavatus]